MHLKLLILIFKLTPVLGGVSGTVSETARAFKGGNVTVKSFVKAVGIGAFAGSVGGASTHIGNNLSEGLNEVGKAVTRVSVQASTAAATDASLQLIDKGEIDTKQLLLSTAGQITIAATSEITQNLSTQNDFDKKASNRKFRENHWKVVEQKDFKNQNLPEQITIMSLKDIQTIMKKVNDFNVSQGKEQEQSLHKEKLTKQSDHPETHGRSNFNLRREINSCLGNSKKRCNDVQRNEETCEQILPPRISSLDDEKMIPTSE